MRGAALPKYPDLRLGFPAGRALERLFARARPHGLMSRPKSLGWVGRAPRSRDSAYRRDGIHTASFRRRRYALGRLFASPPFWLHGFQAIGRDCGAAPELREGLEKPDSSAFSRRRPGVDTNRSIPCAAARRCASAGASGDGLE